MKQLIKQFSKITLLFLTFALFFACEDDDDMQASSLTAGFTYTSVENTEGVVSFINTSSSEATNFEWNFGDGSTSTETNPTKTYDATGDYTVVLTASNASGGTDTFDDMVSVDVPVIIPFDGGLLANGDFETGDATGWFGNAANVVNQGGNFVNEANILTAGAPFNVNLSQVVPMTNGTTYTFTFDAYTDSATGSRTILAGIGLNEAPWTAVTEQVTLTDTPQTFSFSLTANFESANSRVLFDMGAETGFVFIDNVSLFEE